MTENDAENIQFSSLFVISFPCAQPVMKRAIQFLKNQNDDFSTQNYNYAEKKIEQTDGSLPIVY